MARVTPQGKTEGGRDLRDKERMHSSDTTRNAASPIDRPGRRRCAAGSVARRHAGTNTVPSSAANATSPGRPSSPSTWRNWLWAFCATYYCRGHSGMNCGDRSLGFSERQAVTLLLGLARGRRAAAVTIEMA